MLIDYLFAKVIIFLIIRGKKEFFFQKILKNNR